MRHIKRWTGYLAALLVGVAMAPMDSSAQSIIRLEDGTFATKAVLFDLDGSEASVGGGGESGNTDTDDGSIAGAQVGSINLAFSQVWDGSVWRRFTIGTAGTPSAQVVTVQGVTNATAVKVRVDCSVESCVEQYAEDTTHTTADNLMMAGAVRSDSGGTLCDTDGDNCALSLDADGNLRTAGHFVIASAATTIPVSVENGSLTDDDDASIATGQEGIALTAGLQMYYNGAAWVRVTPPPCSDNSLLVVVPVDIVTATTTEIIDGSGASNKAYICSMQLVTNAANNVALVEDDTDACASPSAGMAGGVTAAEGYNFGANGGIALSGGSGFVAKTSAVNRYVCLITSASTQLSGVIIYALAP